jgi:hypothetical protein
MQYLKNTNEFCYIYYTSAEIFRIKKLMPNQKFSTWRCNMDNLITLMLSYMLSSSISHKKYKYNNLNYPLNHVLCFFSSPTMQRFAIDEGIES